jgi:tight adherence protein C
MTTRWLLVIGLGLWSGASLLLAELRWFSRPGLVERLQPYVRGARSRGAGVLAAASLCESVGALAHVMGGRTARLVGVSEELDVRLRRIHAPVDPTTFRVRQVGFAIAAVGIAALTAIALHLPAAITFLVLLGAPLLAFLIEENRLSKSSAAWQRSLFLELPVLAEQISLLLAAGWSLSGALNRVAARGSGVTARDLDRVCRRIRQGVSETAALREWAELARVPALDRLVSVLALNRDTSDLGRLIAEEARAARRDVHRELIETTERREQQVWIPVTVATLVPGVLFMAIPFVEALRLFGG